MELDATKSRLIFHEAEINALIGARVIGITNENLILMKGHKLYRVSPSGTEVEGIEIEEFPRPRKPRSNKPKESKNTLAAWSDIITKDMSRVQPKP